MSLDAPPTTPEAECVDRTRSAVLNVMVLDGAGIAVSGWVLGRLDVGALLLNTDLFWRLSMGALFSILLFSRVMLRVGTGRSALKDPTKRGRRFRRAHVLSALIGGLAVPIGFGHGWAVEPSLQAVAPFWIVAIGVGIMALPRSTELEGFDEPMPSSAESEVRG